VYATSVWPIGQEPVENAIELVGGLVAIVVGDVRDMLELETDPGISTIVENQGQATYHSTSNKLRRHTI
jgi:hypothetical protein